MTTPAATSLNDEIGAFIVGLKEVFTALNQIEGREDDALGAQLSAELRSYLSKDTLTEAEDNAFWKYLGHLITPQIKALLAAIPGVGDNPRKFVSDQAAEKRKQLWGRVSVPAPVTAPASRSAAPARHTPPATPPSSGGSAPTPSPSPLGRTTTDDVNELYQDLTVREMLKVLLGATTEVRTRVMQTLLQALKDPPYSEEFPAKLTKALVAKFDAGEGWAQDAKEEHAIKQEFEAEAQRLRDEEEAEQAEIMGGVIGAVGPTTTTPPPTGRAERPKTAKSDFVLKRLVRALPRRLRWWLSGLTIGAILVLAAFTLYVRQPNHVTERTNNVVTKDETVDEMYSWTVIGSATAGLGIVIGFGLVGIYCSFFERRKESGA